MKLKLGSALLLLASASIYQPLYAQTANGNKLVLPNNDYWLVRDSRNREICQGSGNRINRGEVRGCATLSPGTYKAFNLTTRASGVSVVVRNAQASRPVASGNKITFPNNDYWLVRDSRKREICQGSGNRLNAGSVAGCRTLSAGTYTAFNLTTRAAGVSVVIASGGGNTGGSNPTVKAGQRGSGLNYRRVFTDDFNGSSVSQSRWKFIDMKDGLHRAGNAGLNRSGQRKPNESVSGKRWSAWYDNHRNRTTKVRSGKLEMGGLLTNERDPTRRRYNDNGLDVRFDRNKLYTSFLSTWDRVYDNRTGSHITDPNGPNHTWGPGHFFEMRVSFAQMKTRAFRLSWYLLPAYGNASNAYDGSISNGIENDLFEYDPSPGGKNHLQMKVISGNARGNTPGGSVNLSRFNLQTGYHTIGLLWERNQFVWYVDGVEVQRDTSRVPSARHYMVISREMNSGAKNNPSTRTDLQANPPYLPEDVGIWATNVWQDRGKINSDVGKIDYVRVWKVQ